MPEPRVPVDEVASHFGVANGPVHRWTDQEPLPPHRVGRRSRLKPSEAGELSHAGGAGKDNTMEPTR